MYQIDKNNGVVRSRRDHVIFFFFLNEDMLIEFQYLIKQNEGEWKW